MRRQITNIFLPTAQVEIFCLHCGEKLRPMQTTCPNCGRSTHETNKEYVTQTDWNESETTNPLLQKLSETVNKAKDYLDSMH